MTPPFSVLIVSFVIANRLLLYCLCSINGIKNNGVTNIILLSHAEEILAEGAKVSSSRKSKNYGNINYSEELSFSKLLGDAEAIHGQLEPIMRSLYFRIFRINLDAPCRLRERNDFCSSSVEDGVEFSVEKGLMNDPDANECVPKCYVGRCHPLDFDGSASSLSGLEHFVVRYPNEPKHMDLDPKDLYSNNLWYKDILGFYPEREEKPVYVDLLYNPPSYTGYKGGDDWKKIYDLQCSNEEDVPCNQAEHIYRLISGMQSSVAAWAAWNHKCVNPIEAYQLKKELPRYLSNAAFYEEMLGNHTERLDNMFYTFKAILTTVCRLQPFLTGFAKTLGQNKEYEALHSSLFDFLSTAQDVCKDMEADGNNSLCDEGCQSCHAPNATMQLKHPSVLQRFNEISDLVDCLGCEKCRLHGKLKLTALQIVVRAFGRSEKLMLERNEIVALLHALDYFAQSVIFVQKFNEQRKRKMLLYPTRGFVAAVLIIIVIYRCELRQAFCRYSVDEKENEADDDKHE